MPSRPTLLLCLLLGACAGQGAAPTDPSDPYEATNRQILDVNFALDDAVLKPVAQTYRDAIGPWTRQRIRNVLDNINEPATTANHILQGRPLAAGTSFMRFVINSTMGLGGIFDLDAVGGPPRRPADLGQTLYVWGVPDGPFLMVPILGPSTPREFVGRIGNGFLNPITYVLPTPANLGRDAVQGIDQRERASEALDEIRTGSLDPYARLRSLWRQNRDAELGRSSTSAPDLLDDPAGDAAPAPAPAVRPSAAPAAAPTRGAAVRRGAPRRQPVEIRGTVRR